MANETPDTMTTDLVVIPTTGEIVDLDDPRAVADAVAEIERVERVLASMKAQLREILVREAADALTKTMRWGKRTVVIKGGKETIYDADAIKKELLDAGFTAERVSQIVVETVETTKRVSAAEAKRAAAANPVAAEIIARHSTVIEKKPGVTVT